MVKPVEPRSTCHQPLSHARGTQHRKSDIAHKKSGAIKAPEEFLIKRLLDVQSNVVNHE